MSDTYYQRFSDLQSVDHRISDAVCSHAKMCHRVHYIGIRQHECALPDVAVMVLAACIHLVIVQGGRESLPQLHVFTSCPHL